MRRAGEADVGLDHVLSWPRHRFLSGFDLLEIKIGPLTYWILVSLACAPFCVGGHV